MVNEWRNKNGVNVCTLAQHPCVGGEREVSGYHMEGPAPQDVAGPNRVVEEHQVVPEEPGGAATQQGEDEVLMHAHPGAAQGWEGGEGDEREKQEGQGQREPSDGEGVDAVPEPQVLIIHTVSIVRPGSVRICVHPPLPTLITPLVCLSVPGILQQGEVWTGCCLHGSWLAGMEAGPGVKYPGAVPGCEGLHGQGAVHQPGQQVGVSQVQGGAAVPHLVQVVEQAPFKL